MLAIVFPACICEHHQKISSQQKGAVKQTDGETKTKIENAHGVCVVPIVSETHLYLSSWDLGKI